MENDLSLNIDDVIQFIKGFELTEENVQDIIKYVRYKTILDSFTYVIESSKNSSDTGLFAMKYIEITKELEDIIKILVEKKNKKLMETPFNKENLDQIQDSLLETTINIFHWNVDYYLTEEDTENVLNEKYKLNKITDKINVRILIPDHKTPNDLKGEVSVIEIPIREFMNNKEPRESDMVFFTDIKRFFTVRNSIRVNDFFRVEIEPYEIKARLDF